ncbi:DUF6580 family putative transport protein [Luteimicrobium subarcticum]|uniref:Energy-coupling factor transport system substrate-specific component n=1 Tax=Luteimicrobium subarcticum TaxID=620910 RepID=A0A2M8WRI3_9MICO|nr:DUF6580 family putative transport protein [Luteimicrobium subarcticum]PJI93514.1 hypothetical protein CLV34_2088 [Luteimicrobium subarcticum]
MEAHDVLTPAQHRQGPLALRELAHRWWRPALVVAAVALAVTFRLVKDDLGAPSNLELVTSAAFFGAMLLRNRVAAVFPFVVAVVSDLALGNTSILWFTWSAWAVVGVASVLLPRWTGWRRYAGALGFGIGSSVWFFLWTNFGVWLLGDGSWYPRTVGGLVDCYVAGLPFLRPMLVGNLVLVPLAAGAVTLVERLERAAQHAGVVAR